ncbi:MAG: type II toxin-antitoxin system VapC family toxin [Acidobacteria bacterium]|nr:type II toxin-antitoxin system VapC family toxin [Acidobacteriota bacterium]
MLNLDTHILIAGLAGSLSDREIKIVENDSIAISGIVLWEISKLVQLGRLALDLESPAFKRLLARVTIFPITLEIARQSTELDFRSDPADEIIAATSVVENAPLLTRDRKMLRSRLVPLA